MIRWNYFLGPIILCLSFLSFTQSRAMEDIDSYKEQVEFLANNVKALIPQRPTVHGIPHSTIYNCSICKDQLRHNEDLITVCCYGHKVHPTCLNQWVEENKANVCPFDFTPLTRIIPTRDNIIFCITQFGKGVIHGTTSFLLVRHLIDNRFKWPLARMTANVLTSQIAHTAVTYYENNKPRQYANRYKATLTFNQQVDPDYIAKELSNIKELFAKNVDGEVFVTPRSANQVDICIDGVSLDNAVNFYNKRIIDHFAKKSNPVEISKSQIGEHDVTEERTLVPPLVKQAGLNLALNWGFKKIATRAGVSEKIDEGPSFLNNLGFHTIPQAAEFLLNLPNGPLVIIARERQAKSALIRLAGFAVGAGILGKYVKRSLDSFTDNSSSKITSVSSTTASSLWLFGKK